MSPKITLVSAPSSVRTSTNATTPFKHPPPDVEHIKAASDRSPTSLVSPVIDRSMLSGASDCRGRRTVDNRIEFEAGILCLGWAIWDVEPATLGLETEGAKLVETEGAKLKLKREDESVFFIFSFSSASLSPLTR